MSFRALLVTKDDQVAETLTPVLSNFGLRTECCGYSDAVCLITEQKFQAVLVDYDDPPSAVLILQNLASTPPTRKAKRRTPHATTQSNGRSVSEQS